MELLLTMTILLVLIVLVGDLILMTNKTSEESAKARAYEVFVTTNPIGYWIH
jgi:hypothetical protein